MAESALNKRMRQALKRFDPVRVENVVCSGTPDMNFTFGWIENKFLDHWPKDIDLIVRCAHYTPEQRVWARKRIAKGGRVWLMLQVGRDYLLFRGDVAADTLGLLPQYGLRNYCVRAWHNQINDEELIAALNSWESK